MKTLLAALAGVALITAPVAAQAQHSGGHGGGGHAGAAGFRGGGFHGGGFRGGGFRGRGFGFGFYPGYYDGYYPYYEDEGGRFLVRQRIKTRHGWRARPGGVCEESRSGVRQIST